MLLLGCEPCAVSFLKRCYMGMWRRQKKPHPYITHAACLVYGAAHFLFCWRKIWKVPLRDGELATGCKWGISYWAWCWISAVLRQGISFASGTVALHLCPVKVRDLLFRLVSQPASSLWCMLTHTNPQVRQVFVLTWHCCWNPQHTLPSPAEFLCSLWGDTS